MLSFVLGDFMKNKRKICAALMLISFMSHCATAADDEIFTGSCAQSGSSRTKGCVWTLNKTSGTIVFENPVNFATGGISIDNTLEAFIEEGVIANGTSAVYLYPFYKLPNLKRVFTPDAIQEIGALVYDCPQVEELSVNSIELCTLCAGCTGLKTIHLGPLVSLPRVYNTERYDGEIYLSIVERCPNLVSVNVDEENENLKSVKGALLTKDGKNLNVFPFGKNSNAVIPYGVEEISRETFYGCPFTSVTIPETVKYLVRAFENCSNLSTINFFGVQEPEEKYYTYVFSGCNVINVPHDYNGTTFWGYPVQKVIDHHGYLSDGCTYWMTQGDDTQMTIGGDGALDGSLLADDGSTWSEIKDKIKKVNIDDGITTIDMSIFSGCENLSEVSLPKTVKNVTSLSKCSHLASIIVPEDNDSYSTVDGVLFSKNSAELIHYPSGKSSSSYKIPEGTTTICSNAFSNCKNLQEVTLPESIDRVEAGAFSETSSLETVNYMGKNPPNYDFTFENPPNVQVWTDYNGDELFGVKVLKVFEKGNHDGFSWVFAPESTLTIKGTGIIERYNPLGKLKKLAKRLVIEEGITSLDVAAFYGYDFTDIKLPDTLETIGWSAFDSCRQLTNVVLPSGVKSIGKKAFQGCENLESITLNEGLDEIGRNAFDGCKNLHSITLPKSVKKIEDAALRNSALTEIRVANGNDFYYDVDGVLFSKPDLALVQYPTGQGGHYTVPKNVTKINDSAFACAKDLESVTIQGSLKSIGKDAFYGCYNLKSVHIDGEVECVDDNAFAFCEQLSEVEYEGDPKLGKEVFIGCDKLNATTT